MTTPPLSPAAQAVLDAVDKVCVTTFLLTRRDVAAAAIRALVDQTLPEEVCPTWDGSGDDADVDGLLSRMIIRAQQLAIAAELAGGAGQHTTQPTETASDSER
jgi:hypothetical protein